MPLRSMMFAAALSAVSCGFSALPAAAGETPVGAEAGPAAAGTEPMQNAAAEVSQARLDYGAYLTLAGDCAACHTRPGGEPFAGGLGMQTPFGTIYTPNITPSKDRGIGNFSDEDFLRAMHDGVAPDGTPYYPAFPYPSFTKINDDDVLAIKDYLFSLPPSDYQPPKTELRWPFDARDLMFGWQELYFERGRFQPVAEKGEAWNRGAYLVQGLGHCGACHRPRHALGAQASADALRGALIDGWYPSAASADLRDGLDKGIVDDLASELRTGLMAPGQAADDAESAAPGSMAKAAHAALSKLALSDLHAIAVYLKDQPPAAVATDQSRVPDQLSAQVYGAGRKLYLRYCTACHQREGQGFAPYFPSLRASLKVTQDEANDMLATILLGAPADPSEAYSPHVVMPSFGTLLNDAQIAAVASFIRASWGNDASAVTPEQVARLRGTD